MKNFILGFLVSAILLVSGYFAYNHFVPQKETVKKTITQIESEAKTDIDSISEITEDDIKVAIKYIKDNVNKPIEVLSNETIERLVYYGSYLKNLAIKVNADTDNSIHVLGTKTFTAFKELFEKNVKVETQTISEAKKDINLVIEQIDDANKTIIKDFVSLFK